MSLLLLLGGEAFSPRSLFNNNEQGLWLDPSDFSTMWQDAAGDSPVTAAGDVVGLILDKSRSGPSMGSNQVTNGGFSADSDWTKGTGWTIGSGVATKTAGNASLLSQSQTMTAGRYYIVTYTITCTAGSITPQFAGGSTVSGTARSSSGTFTDIMTVVSGNNTLQFSADASFAGTVDNVSLKELSAGNHAYQTTSGARPTLARIPSSGRRNLLTRSEEFDNASWVKTGAGTGSAPTVTANQAANPVTGEMNADLVVFSRGAGNTTSDRSELTQAPSGLIASGSYTQSVYIKAATAGDVGKILLIRNVAAAGAYTQCTLTADWQRFTRTETYATNSFDIVDRGVFGPNNQATVSAHIWGAQLETGSSATNYQKVVATTDVTESGFNDLWHIVFDGSDDSLVTNAVDMTGTAQMTVIAGVRKLSDASTGTLLEFSADKNSNNGIFAMFAPTANNEQRVSYHSKGTVEQFQASNNYPSPATIVITGSSDISTPLSVIRVNGSQQDQDTGSQGSGNFGNYPLYIGRRGGTELPFNGHLYQLIVRGTTTPTAKLLEAERFTARKTGVTGI